MPEAKALVDVLRRKGPSSIRGGPQEMEVPKELSLINRIRNMWEFANLVQWIFIFGRAVEIESLDIEDLELECLQSQSTALSNIGLALLNFLVPRRKLTPEMFDEYTRKQYLHRARDRNPFGSGKDLAKFSEFDIFTKIRVLQQLTQWILADPHRIRSRMNKEEVDEVMWRIEPFGWDAEHRSYFLLDDNRLYRRTVSWRPQITSTNGKAILRASKRRKSAEDESGLSGEAAANPRVNSYEEADTFGSMRWECIAVTLDEFKTFVASIEKSHNSHEKALRAQLQAKLQTFVTTKKSSRMASRLVQERQAQETQMAEKKRAEEYAIAKRKLNEQRRLEKEKESSRRAREDRLLARCMLREEWSARSPESGQGRLSEQHLTVDVEQNPEEFNIKEDWIDCICGKFGKVDESNRSACKKCEKCETWQHSACVGSPEATKRDDFHFICNTCEYRALRMTFNVALHHDTDGIE